MADRVGVWIVGARGGVATTLVAGSLAIRNGLVASHGLITETPQFGGLRLTPHSNFVFGGHDVRRGTLRDSATQIYRENGTIRHEILSAVGDELDSVEQNIRPGVLFRSGRAIEKLEGIDERLRADDPAAAVAQLSGDIEEFKKAHSLATVVMVNLASTEPSPPKDPDQGSVEGIERLLARGRSTPLIASSLYTLAAARSGCAYVNFTPSPGAFLPGLVETLERAKVPFFGSDGKTGETLVKSALAPMFKYRNLRVLSWQGYNLLGDRDGQVLADEENKSTKVASKDNLLHEFLGYPVHSRVAIDYVPSLNDFKTAWDFIHFQGFLDVKMSMQFTWHGCDSILAAPLVLDLVRMAAFARKSGEAGPMTHLAIFFKNPLSSPGHDLHEQFHRLMTYVQRHSTH